MFVGVTRAQQELQISLARYRDFRGQRKLTIPSSFLMELPRTEMEIEYPEALHDDRADFQSGEDQHSQLVPDDDGCDPDDSQCIPPCAPHSLRAHSHETPCADPADTPSYSTIASPMPHDSQPREVRHALPPKIHLTTAAAMINGDAPSPPVDPNAFRQGTCVLHASYGLGRIVALSGNGPQREATVDFPPPSGRRTLLLADGALRPVGCS